MFKSRGRAYEMQNIAILAQHQQLAKTIRVSQITSDGNYRGKKVQRIDKVVEAQVTPSRNQSTRTKPVLVREPLRSFSVAIPHNKEPSWKFSRLSNNNLLNIVDLQKKYKKIMEDDDSSTPRLMAPDETFLLQKEVEDASLEAEIGNVQLNKVKELLESSKLDKRDNRLLLHNVEKNKSLPKLEEKKNKFLLTVNDVEPRIQKIQFKYFTKGGARFRAIRNAHFQTPNPIKQREDLKEKVSSTRTEEEEAMDYLQNFDSTDTDYEYDRDVGDEREYDNVQSLTDEDFQRKLQEQIKQSEYLTKEFNTEVKEHRKVKEPKDQPFFDRLENVFKVRPFANAKPVKAYLPVYDSLKNTLYSTN